MKKFLGILLSAAMLLSLAACGGSGSSSQAPTGAGNDAATSQTEGEAPVTEYEPFEGDTIIIGGLAPLTGEVSQYGIGVTNGARLAVEEINAAGGILGAQIEYIVYDEQGDATEAVSAYNKLLDDGMVALMGDVTTKPTLAVAQLATEDNMPMVTPTATGADVTAENGDNVFRACFTDPYQGELMAHYAFEVIGAKSVAILYDTTDDYSEGIAETFEATAKELGMEITTIEGYTNGIADFNSQLTKIKAGEPDAVMIPCYYQDAALIITQARGMGIDVPLLGPDGWDGVLEQMDATRYDLLNNTFFCSGYSKEDPSPELQNFMDTYRETYGIEENMFAVLGYEAIYIIAEAIEAAGSVDPNAIVEAIQGLTTEGLTGSISFNGGNDPARDAFIIEFVDGVDKVLGTYGF